MVPTGTGKMGRHFPVMEKSGNFVKTGKVREFYSEYWRNQKKLYWKTERNAWKVREIYQPVIIKALQIWYHTLNKEKNLTNTGKLQKLLEKSGKFVSVKKWEPCSIVQINSEFVKVLLILQLIA